MSTFRRLNLIIGAMAVVGFGCTEQHDPSEHLAQIKHEQQVANQIQPKLTEEGKIPGAGDNKIDIVAKYNLLCSSCHGAEGDGKGPAGQALAVKPRSFKDKAWQSSVDDKHVYTVIDKGGVAVGLNAAMAPWGAILSPEELQLMVKHVRQFAN